MESSVFSVGLKISIVLPMRNCPRCHVPMRIAWIGFKACFATHRLALPEHLEVNPLRALAFRNVMSHHEHSCMVEARLTSWQLPARMTALTAQRFDMQDPTCTRLAIGRVHANVGLSEMFDLKGMWPYQLWTLAMIHLDFGCANYRRCASSTSLNAGSTSDG